MRGQQLQQQRRGKASFANPQQPPPPTPTPRFQYAPPRDSDASFASSRPSSVGINRSTSSAATFDLYKDHRYQSSAVATVNAYLSSQSSTLSLRLPYPSAKDITQTLLFLINRLDFPTNKLDDDLPMLLKFLNYPFKLNKSILKSPGTPHQWPTFLAIIHWLVQVARFNEQLLPGASAPAMEKENTMLSYAIESYSKYISGDDVAVAALDQEWVEKIERERERSAEAVTELERRAVEIQAKVDAAKAGPTRKEGIEQERRVLEEDVSKFNEMIEKLREKIGEMEKEREGKERELGEKEAETGRVKEENDGLRRRVEAQTVNPRDVERMRREMQAVERDTGDSEVARTRWEEKAWDLDATLGHKFNEIVAVALECNQAMRRLKLGDGFQYNLNPKGSTPAEVMGVDYKSTLKTYLESYAEDLKRKSMAKLEELSLFQRLWSDVDSRVKAKSNDMTRYELHEKELEARIHDLQKEIQNQIDRCAEEAKRIRDDFAMESHSLDLVESEAAEALKTIKLKYEQAVEQREDETEKCVRILLALVDSISKFKEHAQSKLSEMRTDITETVAFISDTYKGSLMSQISSGLRETD